MGSVHALAVWEGQLISGHGSWRVYGWDTGTGLLRRELEGHSWSVGSLCVVGLRLACASTSPLIRVWAMGPEPEWACERTLTWHTEWLASLVGWAGKLISGSYDKTMRVWDLETGGLDATLVGHGGAVHGLLVHRERLFSASGDGTIRCGRWGRGLQWRACRRTTQERRGSGREAWRRAGRSSSAGSSPSTSTATGARCGCGGWIRWRTSARCGRGEEAGVWCLVAEAGQVWAGMGSKVVVWGRE